MDPRVKAGIFKGESGGDYNTLFGFSNRPGGVFSNVRLTDMTLDDAIRFSDPSGPYAQYVSNKIGRVATPMGAYQVVGATLRNAKKALGLSGSERMDQVLQDKIGEHILATQGTGAWKGYRGPSDPTAIAAANTRYDPRSDTPSTAHPTGSKLPGPPPAAVGTPLTPEQATGQPASRDDLAALAMLMGRGGDAGVSTFSDQLQKMVANMAPDPSRVGMGNAPQMGSPPGFTQSQTLATVDPQQQEGRRQMLAMAMQRLYGQQGMGQGGGMMG